jgi:alpha-glucosidase
MGRDATRRGARPWWHDAVIYQVYPRSFQDSDGDGIGDLPGIESRLEYLRSLGVDALWLSPIYPSPLADFGYDISNYTDVDPTYGTLEDFDRLLAHAHDLGMRLILDLVPNHTSVAHSWFVSARSSRGDRYRDWYLWHDPAPDGGPPNNWLSVFGGSAWTFEPTTGQYYLHSFLPEQPDLNWRNPEVVAAIRDVMRFWLDRGVDGFRVDVIHFLLKDARFRDDPPNPDFVAASGTNPWHGLRHQHSSDLPEVHDLVRGFRRTIDAYDDRVLIGEIEYGSSPERVCSYYGDGDELHLPLNFALMTLPWHAPSIAAFMTEYDARVPRGASPSYVLANHDRSRVASRIGTSQARVAAMLLLTARNTPFVYYGDELGMPDAALPPERTLDPWGKRVPGHGRDAVRTPMRWNASRRGAFTAGQPWLPADAVPAGIDVASQLDDPGSMLALYRRLLALRRERPVLRHGSQHVWTVDDDVLVLQRELGGRRVVIALNLGDVERSCPLPSAATPVVLLSTHLDRAGESPPGTLTLRPNEGCIVDLGGGGR